MSAGTRRHWQMAARACAIPIPVDQAHARGDAYLVAAWRPLRDAAPRVLLSAPSTAFLVTPRHVVTAAHALPPDGVPDLVYAFGYAHDRLRPAQHGLPEHFVFPAASVFRLRGLCRRTLGPRDGDVAVIELERDVPPDVATPLVPASREPQLGEPIALTGGSDGQPIEIRAGRESDGTVVGYDDVWLDHDVEAGPGWSGAPVLDAEGRVLAVHVGTAVDAPLARSVGAFGAVSRRMRACRFAGRDLP